MDWGWFKRELGEQLRISDDALHVHAGMAIWLLAALLLRRPLSDWRPLAIVAAIEAINEIYDMRSLAGGPGREGSPFDSAHDFILTLLWPVTLALCVKLFQRFGERR
jgi:hypothetical protein